jgi:uncharacterized Zn finger protein
MTTHTEKIRCPECKTEQEAKVLHTFPFYSYVHECTECGYIIMESEWIVIDKTYISVKTNAAMKFWEKK